MCLCVWSNLTEKNGVITCQHGHKECHANTIQGCAQSLYPDQKQWFSFIVCVEKARDPLAAGKRCAKASKMSWNSIEECAIGSKGKQILAANARRTLDLNPPNRYVPWITINGQVRRTHTLWLSLLQPPPNAAQQPCRSTARGVIRQAAQRSVAANDDEGGRAATRHSLGIRLSQRSLPPLPLAADDECLGDLDAHAAS